MAVYAVTYDSKSSYITNGKRYRVESEDRRGLFRTTSDLGSRLTCLWEGCAHLGTLGNWTRIEEEEQVTLRPGDYVSTEGMTEDQYHAVARAFMAAGAKDMGDSEYGRLGGASKNLGWDSRDDELWNSAILPAGFTGRQLTPAQVIGAVNAGNQQEEDSRAQYRAVRSPFFSDGSIVEVHEYDTDSSSLFRLVSGECRYNNADGMPGAWDSFDNMELISMNDNMTPCEKLGYKAGDRFVTNGSSAFTDGSEVELFRGDGTDCPLSKLLSGYTRYALADGERGAHADLKFVTPHAPEDTLTQTLREATEHDEKAKHHAAEHDRLMQRARDMLPDGWMLVRGGVDWAKGKDMSDPENWREGDILECINDDWFSFEEFDVGNKYEMSQTLNSDGMIMAIDDDGDKMYSPADQFRFHHRPT